MAKKKKKSAVPKRIAGMKVPKALRRGRVARLMASPVGQALMIETVARAGERLIGGQSQPGSAVRRSAARSQEAVADFGDSATETSAAFAYALRQAARAFVNAMQEQQLAARDERRREPEAQPAGGDGEKLEKKERGERPDRRTAH